jgi:hypothetical protein
MHWTRIIASLLLSFSIALAGLPAQAMPECSMAKMQQQVAIQDMGTAHDCDGCPKAEKKQSQKSGCCDDTACNVKCSASSGMNMSAAPNSDFPALMKQSQRLYVSDSVLASHLLNTQDRPPKSLA